MTDEPGKRQLRESLQKARMAIGEAERHKRSEAIASRLFEAVEWSVVGTLHCFEPIMHLGEVDLVDFIAALQAGELRTHVYTSRKIGGEWLVVDTDDDKPAAPVPKFDAIIVPMLGFDPKTLHRVGYGGGYYDKFLAAQPQARKIGACFETGRLSRLAHEPHDVELDMIVTEQKVYGSAIAPS